MQPGSVHIHYKERPEERILSRLGPKKDDLRTVGGEVHRCVARVKRISRQPDTIRSVGHLGKADTISLGVGIVRAIERYLLAVGRPGTRTEVQRRVVERNQLAMGPIRAHDRCRDSLAVRSERRPQDLGSVGREAGAALATEIADEALMGPVRRGCEE